MPKKSRNPAKMTPSNVTGAPAQPSGKGKAPARKSPTSSDLEEHDAITDVEQVRPCYVACPQLNAQGLEGQPPQPHVADI